MTVGIVGAGISGLALAHFLDEQGIDSIVFERDEQPGGIIQSRTVDGHVLELGPQRLRGTKPIEDLIAEFDLEDERFEGHTDQPLFVYHRGKFRVAPLSLTEAITTDLLSWRGKLRVLAEPLTGGQQPGESVEGFLTRKFGKEAARRFMGPLYTGLYGSDPDEMLVEYSLGKALERHGIEGSILLTVAKYAFSDRDLPPIVSFEDGMQRLPEAMAERYADRLHFETEVTAIEEAGNGYEITAGGGTYEVDAVAMTAPAPTAAEIVEPMDEDLADTLSRFNYNPLGMAHLYSDFDREGHGCQILAKEGYTTLGMTWNASMLDRDGVYTSYLGGGRNAELVEKSDAEIGEIAAEEFEDITGHEADVLNVHRWVPGMPAYDRSWEAMEDLEPPEGMVFVSNYTERAGIIGRVGDAREKAGELAAYLE